MTGSSAITWKLTGRIESFNLLVVLNTTTSYKGLSYLIPEMFPSPFGKLRKIFPLRFPWSIMTAWTSSQKRNQNEYLSASCYNSICLLWMSPPHFPSIFHTFSSLFMYTYASLLDLFISFMHQLFYFTDTFLSPFHVTDGNVPWSSPLHKFCLFTFIFTLCKAMFHFCLASVPYCGYAIALLISIMPPVPRLFTSPF